MIRPRRSLLFMPGSNARALEKARNLPADGLILDLEDSVAPDFKAMARDQIAQAIAAEGFSVFELPSGAGHDGMAMIDIADVGMIFVRCRGGVSHHPDEHVELADADAGARWIDELGTKNRYVLDVWASG